MKRKIIGICMTLAMTLALVTGAVAEEKKSGTSVKEIKDALGMSIYLQGGYTYNFEDPDSRENDLRVFDHEANSFTLDLAQLVFVREPEMNGVGYKLKFSVGETAKFIHSRGLGSTEDVFDLTEAYVSYVAPLGKGLRFDFGKMVTFTGAEVIEAIDNPNYSRSFLFNYAIPFTHTGLKVSYPLSDKFTGALYIVNGWDNTEDNNSGKTIGLSLGVIPVEQVSMYFNILYGAEQDDSSNKRFLFDWVGTIKPVKNLYFSLNFDYANDEDGAGPSDAEWYGFAGIVKYDFTDWFSLALRGEYFKDDDGVRTGTVQALKEFTLTPEFRLAGGSLIIRPEYRHDWSDKEAFNSGKDDSQDTISLSMMYRW